MKAYALYNNGNFVVAKPFFAPPTSPSDFGIGAISTSCYDIAEILKMNTLLVASMPATIDVGSRGLIETVSSKMTAKA